MSRRFDDFLSLYGSKLPLHLVDSSVYVNDTLEIANRIARDLFGGEVSENTVISIYDRIKGKHDELKDADEDYED
jgi:hypothetical protein